MDFFRKINEKRQLEKEEYKAMERELKLQRRLEQKMKSPAQKEYEFYQREKKQEALKKALDFERKRRAEKMKQLSNPFNHKDLINNNNDLSKADLTWIQWHKQNG